MSVFLYSNEMIGDWEPLDSFGIWAVDQKDQGMFRGLGFLAPHSDLWGGERGWRLN